MFHVYILRCSDASFYVGSCSDLPARLAAHHRGEASARTAALSRERQTKRWTRAKKAALIDGDLERLRSLARCSP